MVVGDLLDLSQKESNYETIDGFIVSPEIFERIQAGEGRIMDLQEALNVSDHRLVRIDIGNSVKADFQ